MLSHSSPPAEEPALTTTPLRLGRRGHAGRASRPEPGVGAPDRRRLISIKANSVGCRAEFIPCAWKVRCQLVCVARLLARMAFVRYFRPGYRDHRHEVI